MTDPDRPAWRIPIPTPEDGAKRYMSGFIPDPPRFSSPAADAAFAAVADIPHADELQWALGDALHAMHDPALGEDASVRFGAVLDAIRSRHSPVLTT
jgi:hypothetical protein